MTKIQNWASHNIDAIQNCFKEKRYNDLLRIYEKYSGLSQVQLAINLKCDRKSVSSWRKKCSHGNGSAIIKRNWDQL